MKFLFVFICLLLVLQLVYPFVTILMAQIFHRTHQQQPIPEALNYPTLNYACIITAYRNAAIARPLVDSLLHQTHPNLGIYLVADECPEFDFALSDQRLVVLKPSSPLRLKAKSLLYALENFNQLHDYVVVFDADNLAHPQFLEEINHFAAAGFRCVQGQRKAKNLDTIYAALDSMGEHYKNYIERDIPYHLGGSAVISGSGMATETAQYKAYLTGPEITQGQLQWKRMLQEDKILQNFLVRKGERIAYARRAIVFDEKVETGKDVETQRSRWLFSYFQNVPNALDIVKKGILGLNFNQLYFGCVTLALPMFIQLGMAMIMMVLAIFIAPSWSLILFAAMAIFALTIIWALYLDGAPAAVLRAVWQVPKFVFWQFAGLFKMRNPDKYFKHTEHRKIISLNEVPGQTAEPEEKA
ncbi:MAG: glycosyltransferase [Saprospiraceae bacterium]